MPSIKPSKKAFSLIKILVVFIKKHRDIEWTSRYKEYQEVKNLINCGENYTINTRLNLKVRLVWEKKKNIIINKMSSSNVFRRVSSGFRAADSFQALSLIFVYGYLPKKELARMEIHVCKILNCEVSVKFRCQCASRKKLLRKNFEHSCDK